MYSLETLRDLNEQEIKDYIAEKPPVKLTTVDAVKIAPDWSGLSDEEIENHSGKSIVKTYFVDSSGFGIENERALTYDTFRKQLLKLTKHGKKPYYAVISGVGQFQVCVTILKGDL